MLYAAHSSHARSSHEYVLLGVPVLSEPVFVYIKLQAGYAKHQGHTFQLGGLMPPYQNRHETCSSHFRTKSATQSYHAMFLCVSLLLWQEKGGQTAFKFLFREIRQTGEPRKLSQVDWSP